VVELKADIGIAFDGDADRIGVVDEKGQIIFGDKLLLLYAREILTRKPGATIIGDVKSSKQIYDDIAKRGGKPLMWKTGHSLIKAKMKETHAAMAGEMSGHMFFNDRWLGFDDAVYAACRILEILDKANAPLSSLLADVPKLFSTPEIRFNCPEEIKFKIVARAIADL
jgi:phosphomannomutase/phosphoglucomutase